MPLLPWRKLQGDKAAEYMIKQAWARGTAESSFSLGAATGAGLREYYYGPYDTYVSLNLNYWYAQTFTPLVTHTLGSAKVNVTRKETTATLTISLRAIGAGGVPTGSDLSAGTSNLAIIYPTIVWCTVTLLPAYQLQANTMYALVIRDSTDNANTWLYYDTTSPTYTRGNYCQSSNTGTDWTSDTSKCLLFAEYGA